MPPYSRETAASAAACLNEVKVRAGISNISSVLSVYVNLSPNKYVSTSDTAVDTTLCPLVYSGKGGVCNKGCHLMLIYRLIYVSGLMRFERNFSSQQLINAS